MAVDGLPSYVGAFQRAFRTKVPRRRQVGLLCLLAATDLTIRIKYGSAVCDPAQKSQANRGLESLAHVTLKRLLSKRKPAYSIVGDLIRTLDVAIFIEDMEGNVMLDESSPESPQEPPNTPADLARRVLIEHGDRQLGWVYGGTEATVVAALLQHLAAAEAEKRAMAEEVLDRYRELNLLYNLSENLAFSLKPEAVAAVALDQAIRLIEATAGFVVIQDDDEKPGLTTIAAIGEEYQFYLGPEFDRSLVGQAIQTGRAEIQNDVPVNTCFFGAGDGACSLLIASLKTGEHVFGLMVLVSQPPVKYSAGDLKLLNTVALSAAPYMAIARLYAHQVAMANTFSRFVPHEFLRFLESDSILDMKLGDHVRQELALLVSDIRAFTSLSENMTPSENFEFINRYLVAASPIIRQNHGFIVKYGGDSILALFPDGVDDALRASLDTMREIEALNARAGRRGFPQFQIGIGLHVGSVMVGIVGEAERLQGDVFSDVVNVAARIESLTRSYDVGIAMSAEALTLLKDPDACEARFLGDTRVKGRNRPVSVYEVREAL